MAGALFIAGLGSRVCHQVGSAGGLFVRDQFAHVGDVLLELGDFFGPGAVCVIGVGDSGSVLTFGFG